MVSTDILPATPVPQYAILMSFRAGTAACCWHGYCTQNGGTYTVDDHPVGADWFQTFWAALLVRVVPAGPERWRLWSIEQKLLDLGPMDWNRETITRFDVQLEDILRLFHAMTPRPLVLDYAEGSHDPNIGDGLLPELVDPESCQRRFGHLVLAPFDTTNHTIPPASADPDAP